MYTCADKQGPAKHTSIHRGQCAGLLEECNDCTPPRCNLSDDTLLHMCHRGAASSPWHSLLTCRDHAWHISELCLRARHAPPHRPSRHPRRHLRPWRLRSCHCRWAAPHTKSILALPCACTIARAEASAVGALVPLVNHGLPCMFMGFLLPRARRPAAAPTRPSSGAVTPASTSLCWACRLARTMCRPHARPARHR